MSKIIINQLMSEKTNGHYRVSAQIDGSELWFSSPDIELYPSPEGFASASIFPSIIHNRDISIETRLDGKWIRNIEKLFQVYKKWWNYSEVTIDCEGIKAGSAEKRAGVSLCFTGGVDSFYSLHLKRKMDISHLLYIQGYDVRLEDRARLKNISRNLEQVGKATSTIPVSVRTNLRQHPLYSGVSWERSHGGALAAAAHMLSGISHLIISASFPFVYDHPWGTHWDTDHLWSGNDLHISHFGAELWRTEKLIELKDSPLAQKYLRVCWEHRNSDLNCCQCEKCLRTMLILNQCGRLRKFRTFTSKQLHKSVTSLKRLDPYYIPVYEEFLKNSNSWRLSRALKKLLQRSRGK